MEVLAYAATIGRSPNAPFTQLCRIEYEAVATGLLTPCVQDAFATMAGAGTQLTVVGRLDTTATRNSRRQTTIVDRAVDQQQTSRRWQQSTKWVCPPVRVFSTWMTPQRRRRPRR